MDMLGRRGGRKRYSRSGGTRDQMEVCLDENELLRRGEIIWLDLYHKFDHNYNGSSALISGGYLINKSDL